MINSKQIIELLKQKHKDDFSLSEVKTGTTWMNNHYRLDYWAMPRSWSQMVIKGYEIKVSRSDFLNDKKWQNYLDYCHEFYFVCPNGLIDVNELPSEAGLYWVTSKGTRLIKKKQAARRTNNIPESLYQYILMSRVVESKNQFQNEGKYEFYKRLLAERNDHRLLGHAVSGKIKKALNTYCQELRTANKRLENENISLSQFKKLLVEFGIENVNDYYRFCDLKNSLEVKAIEELQSINARILGTISRLSEEKSKWKKV